MDGGRSDNEIGDGSFEGKEKMVDGDHGANEEGGKSRGAEENESIQMEDCSF